MKIFKHAERVEGLYSEYSYTHQQDSAVHTL